MNSIEPSSTLAKVIARLRQTMARALVSDDDPADDRAVLEDLIFLESRYKGDMESKVLAFANTIRDPASIPGVSRSVVFARGQRFLLALAIEEEDSKKKKKPDKKKSKEALKSAQKETILGAPFDEELLSLRGVGKKTAARLASRGIYGPRDLLFLLPNRYDDRRKITPISDLEPGQRLVTSGIVSKVRVFGPAWKQMMEVELVEGDDKVMGTWFSKRRPHRDRFVKGARVCLAGLVSEYRGRLQIAHPVVVGEGEETDRIGRIVPVYPDVPGVAGRTVEKAVRSAASRAEEFVTDPLPKHILDRRAMMPVADALKLVHLPPDDVPSDDLDEWVSGSSPAHRRLVYDEFFFIQLALALRRARYGKKAAPPAKVSLELAKELGGLLGFEPTAAQERVIGEITEDMGRPNPMQRLLQGDVGSGKTFVALCAIVAAVRSGQQAALMAPTEILAEQHMRTLFTIFERLGIRVALHIGQMRSSTRKKNLAGFESGRVQVAIGTHALVQESVGFHRLGLAIVDEQHRFGVSQRLSLVGKGPGDSSPHLLVMTATPIPRTLALTVHGNLDVSVIDEMPPRRTEVKTYLWASDQRNDALAHAESAMDRGEQVYVVCPIIEESKSLDVRAATSVFEELKERFGKERTGFLHGRLQPEEKEESMSKFISGQTSLLVTTTVIEVGVDVPSATVMIVEGAERFGLAQLHQLRGRVGRSHLESSCHLIADPKGADAMSRLKILAKTSNGFEVAEADLQIRGPGEIYGRRQAGLPGFKYGNIIRDANLLIAAREDVVGIIGRNSKLDGPEGQGLKAELARRILAGDGPVGEEAG